MKTAFQGDFLTVGVERTSLHFVERGDLKEFWELAWEGGGEEYKEASSWSQLLYFLKYLLPETPGAKDKACKQQKDELSFKG